MVPVQFNTSSNRMVPGMYRYRCCGSALVSMRIRIQHFWAIRTYFFGDPGPFLGIWRPKIEKFYNVMKFIFFISNCSTFKAYWRMSKLQEKPPAPKREHPAIRNINILHFSFFARLFVLLDQRIRIHLTKLNENPDAQSIPGTAFPLDTKQYKNLVCK